MRARQSRDRGQNASRSVSWRHAGAGRAKPMSFGVPFLLRLLGSSVSAPVTESHRLSYPIPPCVIFLAFAASAV